MNRYYYWNLHKGRWSEMRKGKVTGRWSSVVLWDVEFRVRPGGHARVLREGRKNVHAFAIGYDSRTWEEPEGALVADDFSGQPEWIEISYNPFRVVDDRPSFYRKDTGVNVTYARQVALTKDKRVFARGVN